MLVLVAFLARACDLPIRLGFRHVQPHSLTYRFSWSAGGLTEIHWRTFQRDLSSTWWREIMDLAVFDWFCQANRSDQCSGLVIFIVHWYTCCYVYAIFVGNKYTSNAAHVAKLDASTNMRNKTVSTSYRAETMVDGLPRAYRFWTQGQQLWAISFHKYRALLRNKPWNMTCCEFSINGL